MEKPNLTSECTFFQVFNFHTPVSCEVGFCRNCDIFIKKWGKIVSETLPLQKNERYVENWDFSQRLVDVLKVVSKMKCINVKTMFMQRNTHKCQFSPFCSFFVINNCLKNHQSPNHTTQVVFFGMLWTASKNAVYQSRDAKVLKLETNLMKYCCIKITKFPKHCRPHFQLTLVQLKMCIWIKKHTRCRT